MSKIPPTDIRIGNPERRPRRMRRSSTLRDLVQEHVLRKEDLIAPLFVSEAGTARTDVPSLPGVSRVPLPELVDEVAALQGLGLKAVVLFPVIDARKKDTQGSEACNPNGLVQSAVRAIKERFPTMIVFADVALDPFTSHGHDGITGPDGDVLNDETVHALCAMSLTLAAAGVDFVAPSDMMDGRIGAIRTALDAAGHTRTGILAYSAKYASAFYGPFRDAIVSGARGLDKRTYQLSPGNAREAMDEVDLDVDEGADMVMVKPALPYLDIVTKVRARCQCPVVAYHVSGEYAMLKAAVQNNWLDEKPAVMETLLSIKRAGADLIVTYYARWAAENLLK